MVVIIVVTYAKNALQPMEEALNGFRHGTVHIADNGANKETEELASQNGWEYTAFPNFGYGRAFNHAVGQYLDSARGFVVANDDLILDAKQLNYFVELSEETLNEFPNSGPIAPVYAIDVPKEQHKIESHEVDFNAAALWYLSVKCLSTVGGFHPDFFMYAEDKEYCYRSRYYNFSPRVLVNFHVVHPFDYPPGDTFLWKTMIENTLRAIALDLNKDCESAWVHGIKMVVYSAITGQIKRMSYSFRALRKLAGYSLQLISKRRQLKADKAFRFIRD